MLIFKFLALLGAAVGVYIAAALQSSLEVADANLCKLLRRISSAIPNECTQSIDNYGTVIAIVFVLACVLLLLWDFRKHVFVSKKVSAAIKRLWAKVEPSHLIILGLAIAVVGMGWQLYRGAPTRIVTVTKKAETPPIISLPHTPLTAEDTEFRLLLRKFILSNIAELNQNFGYVLGISNDVSNNMQNIPQAARPKMAAALNFFNSTLNGFFRAYKPIIDAANAPIETLNVDDVAPKLKAYFGEYP